MNKTQALKSVFGLPISVSQTSLPGGMGGVKVKPQHWSDGRTQQRGHADNQHSGLPTTYRGARWGAVTDYPRRFIIDFLVDIFPVSSCKAAQCLLWTPAGEETMCGVGRGAQILNLYGN